MKTIFRTAALLLPLLLTACIQVKDLGPFWDSGVIDPTIEGTWTSMERGGAKMVFTVKGRSYLMTYVSEEAETEPKFVRTLKIGENNFLMVKEHMDDIKGTLIAYAVANNQMALFAPHREKKELFLETYPNNPFVVSRTMMTIPVLNKESYDMLAILASDPKWWQEIKRYYRK